MSRLTYRDFDQAIQKQIDDQIKQLMKACAKGLFTPEPPSIFEKELEQEKLWKEYSGTYNNL